MQKILQFCSVAEVFETIDSQIFEEFRQLPEYAFIGLFMWTILFYSILLYKWVYLRASRSCPDAQVWKLIHLQTPLDWTSQGMTGKSASQPILQGPGKEPSSLLGASMRGSRCSGSPAATFKGAISMDPDLSSAVSADPRRPRVAQCTELCAARSTAWGPRGPHPACTHAVLNAMPLLVCIFQCPIGFHLQNSGSKIENICCCYC